MPKQESMSAEEYRNKFVKPAKGATTISAKEWQEGMKKKTKKTPDDKNRREIGFMLELAKIEYEEEFQFTKTRKWRFDFAIPDRMIAIEYEGIFSGKSRHTTKTGYEGDTEKYNTASMLGWTILRYTANTYKNVVNDLWNLTIKK